MGSRAVLGQIIGQYRIAALMGAGGMGEVYRARDTSLERDVAIKILPVEAVSDSTAKARLLREARTASQLNHPNICTIYEVGEADGQDFIAMELVSGQALSIKLLAGPLAAGVVLHYGVQMADALAHAHLNKVVDRDLKSANVMVTSEGRVKVLDFGLAKRLLEAEPDGATHSQASLTQPGAIVGTLGYMSPEQLRGQAADARSDIWALGIVLYEMLAGRLPFRGATAFETSSAILQASADPLPPGVPASLRALIERCVEKEPERRFQNGGELRAALETIQGGGPLPAFHDTGGRSLSRWFLWGSVAGVLAVLLAAVFILGRFPVRHATASSIDSIAVLPFENLTHDQKAEYLSDGVTESLINSLSQLPNMKVIARSSVFQYKGQKPDFQQVARQLGVRAILTGRAIEQGDTIRISAELMDVQNNSQLWGDHYARKAVDIFTVEDDIAREITDALRLRLTIAQQEQLTKRYTENPEAYRLYLQGRYYFNESSEESSQHAVQSFTQAIELDPRYALAYAARAETFFNMGDINLPMSEAKRKVEDDVEAALRIDPNLPEARMMRAYLRFQFDWDLRGAEEEFKRVIALDPNRAEAHDQYAYYLVLTGRPMEAIPEVKLAQQLDPVNRSISVDLGLPYYLGRQYDEAIAAIRKAGMTFPTFWLAHMALGSALFEKGDHASGIQELEKAKALEPNPVVLGMLGNAYARSGRKEEARKLLADLNEQSKTHFVASYWIAMIYVGMGEKDEAFAWLDKAYQEHSFWLMWIKMDPKVDSLRSDPRFTALMRRVGLPQ